MSTRPADVGTEQGFITLFVLVLSVAMFMAFALVGQGGAVLAARAHLASVAEQAALAGAATAAPGTPGQTMLDPAAAANAANEVLSANRVSGQVSVTGTVVSVHTNSRVPTPLFAVFSDPSVAVVASSSANAVGGA